MTSKNLSEIWSILAEERYVTPEAARFHVRALKENVPPIINVDYTLCFYQSADPDDPRHMVSVFLNRLREAGRKIRMFDFESDDLQKWQAAIQTNQWNVGESSMLLIHKARQVLEKNQKIGEVLLLAQGNDIAGADVTTLKKAHISTFKI